MSAIGPEPSRRDPQRLQEILTEIDRKLEWLDEQGWRVTLRTGKSVKRHRRDYLTARAVVVQELERLGQPPRRDYPF